MARRVQNQAKGAAFALDNHERLITGVLTCFFKEPKAYGDTSDDIIKAARKVIEVEPEFVAKLACYARNEFHMRTISQVLAAEVANGARGNKIIRPMVSKVIERPDDMTNILAYHVDKLGPRDKNPIPRSLRRGIADAFPRFDEYQLAKYKGEKGLVKLRDALLITHPKPANEEMGALWKKLIEGRLAKPQTRETILSERGQSKEVWEEFIDSGKMGYMAMLRNINNFVLCGVDKEHLEKVLHRLSDQRAVERSKQLPFGFFAAYKKLSQGHAKNHPLYDDIVSALDKALEHSASNLPRLDGTTFMTADESGSMNTPIAKNSSVQQIDIGNLLMSIAHGFCDKAIVTVFGNTTAEVNLSRTKGVLNKMAKIQRDGQKVGWSTCLNTAIDYLNKSGKKVDRIIVFSDMQAYDTSFGSSWGYSRGTSGLGSVQTQVDKYKRDINPDVWVHSIDLSGYGSALVDGKRVNRIGGWSDKVLEFIKMTEESGTSMIDKVRGYEI